jgi:hypothetical protein
LHSLSTTVLIVEAYEAALALGYPSIAKGGKAISVQVFATSPIDGAC